MTNRHRRRFVQLGFAILCLMVTDTAVGLDHVTLKRDGSTIKIEGRVLVTAQDGGLLLEGRDGVLWTAQPDDLVEHTCDDQPFVPLTKDEMKARLLAELPPGFDVHETAHYLICYDTSRAYAQWCGSLFERLYRAFTNTWKGKGFELSEPEFPLTAIVFASRASYIRFSQPELGAAAKSIFGHFSLRTNRMVMFDLTGIEQYGSGGRPRGTATQINLILSQPDAARNVSTIVHEATHQIGFNCGLHARYSDCPVWFAEGIAMYCETPDLSRSRGWRGIGSVNLNRLEQFVRYFRSRPSNSLRTLIVDDKRFRDPKVSLDAYAEAWSLTYFLIRQRPKQFVGFMKTLREKGPLLRDDPETRLKEFESAFGDIGQLDVDFIRYMRRLR